MSAQNQNEKSKVLGFADGLENHQPLQDDTDIDRKLSKDLSERSRAYNKILSHYEKSIAFNLTIKHVYKIATFVVTLLILLITVIGFFVIFAKCSSFILIDRLTIIIPLIISFLTVFIVIPKIITEYLFNKNEEKYMMELLGNLLKFDINMKEHIDKGDV